MDCLIVLGIVFLAQELVIGKRRQHDLANCVLRRKIRFGNKVFWTFFADGDAIYPVLQDEATGTGGLFADGQEIMHGRLFSSELSRTKDIKIFVKDIWTAPHVLLS
jgi:hypothetical protein